MPSTFPFLSALSAGLTLASCATYNQRTADALADFESGRFENARVAYAEDSSGESSFLGGAETGMVALTAGDWAMAQEHLTSAADAVHELEQEALISPEKAGEFLLSWVLNDTFRDYHGEGYERVMLHACLALSYLAQGQLEDVVVEVRLANALLETEQELYNARYAAGGLGHFLSAIAYELRGDLDDAYIDYKRMERKGIGGELVGRSLVRLAGALHRDHDRKRWERAWGPDPGPLHDYARVIVIAGVGLGPFKIEHKLTLPTGDGLVSWAVPSFRERDQQVPYLNIEAPGSGLSVRSVVLEDVGAVATRNLEDRIAWLAAKSTVRTFLKRELRQKLAQKHGTAGAVAGDLFTILSERADLRAWTTLPDTWQAARMFLEPGLHPLELRAAGGARIALGTFDLEAGETLFVFARSLRRDLYAYTIGGQRVQNVPAQVLEDLEGSTSTETTPDTEAPLVLENS